MYHFMGKAPVTTTTTTVPNVLNPTSVFTTPVGSQPATLFGTSQPFTSGFGMQNTSFNPPTSTTPVNFFTSAGTAGTSVFGGNHTALAAQPTGMFPSNLSGTPVKFNPVPTQGIFPTASTASNIFGVKNIATTTTANSNVFNTSGFVFGQPISSAPATKYQWKPVTNPVPATHIFGPLTSAIPNPFDAKPSATSATTSTAITNPFVIQPITTQSPFQTWPNAPAPATFVPESNAGTNMFIQAMKPSNPTGLAPTSATNTFGVPISSTVTGTPAFPVMNPTSNAVNIFGVPVVTTANTVPVTTVFGTQSVVPMMTSFPVASAAMSPFHTNAPTALTIQPQLFQNPPTVTSSSPIIPPSSTQAQNTQQTASITQQQFLAASLLDPYANRGRKDFSNTDYTQVLKEAPAVSSVSATTVVTTLTTSTPISATLPIQSNLQKVSSSRSSIDVNFKLKPVSSSTTLNDDIKSANQQSTPLIGQTKNTLAGKFTDEEEIALLSRTKLSKLRLSNDSIDASGQSNTIRSLYPLRRLADLEKLANLTPPSSPTTIVNNEQILRPSTENHQPIPSVISQQSSSPIIQHKSTTSFSTDQLPVLTRDNYYMKPSLIELKSSFNDKGQCILKQFTVGHENYGSVTFYGQINVAGLNLDEIIEINHQEVIVYPDDNHKPAVGEGLNRPARITLLGIYPTDRTTHEEITDADRIQAMNYTDHLRETTKKFDGEFVHYSIKDGSWTFMVKHFTRYGIDKNQDDVIDHNNMIFLSN